MADHIQFDGRTYAQLADAASIVGTDEAHVRLLGTQGKVFLRAVGKKIYVDVEGLRKALAAPPAARLVQQEPPAVAANAAQTKEAPPMAAAPSSLHQSAALPHAITMLSQVASAKVAQAQQRATSSIMRKTTSQSKVMQTQPRVYISPATEKRIQLPTNEAKPTSSRATASAPHAIPAKTSAELSAAGALSAIILPPTQHLSAAGRSVLTTGAALAAFVFVVGLGVAASSHAPAALTWADKIHNQVASAVRAGSVSYSPTMGTVESATPQNSPSELQASATATTLLSSATTSQPIYYVYNYPVIERVTEEVRYINASTPAEFNAALDDLYNRIQQQIQSLSITTNTSFAQQYQVISQSSNIDQLGSITIEDSTITGGTISGATISGGSVTATAYSGTLGIANGGTGTTTAPSANQVFLAAADGTWSYVATSSLGISGGADTSVSNTWTALQLFSGNASSTNFSTFGTAYFGGNSTTTIDSTGAITVTSSSANTFPYASTTALTVSGTAYFGNIFSGTGHTITGTYAFGSGATHSISGSYAFAGGGQQNTLSAEATAAVGGYGNTASQSYAFVGGGQANTASNVYAAIIGGVSHVASGAKSFIGGGEQNTVSGENAASAGGYGNTASAFGTFAGGGQNNQAQDVYDAVVGGTGNVANGGNAFIGGGTDNDATGDKSGTVGGYGNTAAGESSFVGGGQANQALDVYDVVLGGAGHTVNGGYSFALGGQGNTVTGDYSGAFGRALTVSGTGSFGFGLDGGSHTISANNTFAILGGNVGIGTTTPSAKLVVQNDSSNNVLLVKGSGGSTVYFNNLSGSDLATIGYANNHLSLINSNPSGSLLVYTGGSERLRITETGNVGIGTTTPWGKLSITATDNASAPQFVVASSSATSLVVTASGNVGIGTTQPEQLLRVGVTSSAFDHDGTVAIGSDASGIALHLEENTGAEGWKVGINAAGDMLFDDSTAGNTMVIFQDGTGNVGIGTTTPASKLNIHYGSVSSSDTTPLEILRLGWDGSSADEQAGVGVKIAFHGSNANNLPSTAEVANIGTTRVSGVEGSTLTSLLFSTNDGTTLAERLRITGAGDLIVAATNSSGGNTSLCWDGSGSSTWGGCTSLAKYKDNVTNLSLGLDAVLQLRPVEFDWNEHSAAIGHDLGFIAEEVEAISPLLAEHSGQGGALSGVKYNTMSALLVRAVQDIANLADAFKVKLIAWFGNAGNGIADFFADNVRARNQLCVGSTCVNEAQLAALLANSASGAGGNGSPAAPGAEITPVNDTEPPTITILGNNPATVQVGDAYSDLGASVSDPSTGSAQANENLGIKVSVNGGEEVELGLIVIDTSLPGEHTIEYRATDQAGNVGTATRTVIVEGIASDGDQEAEEDSLPQNVSTEEVDDTGDGSAPDEEHGDAPPSEG